RTYNKWSPFPEEMNRQLTGRLADLHFAPTPKAKQNLLAENVNEKDILVTGNTVIDALMYSIKKVQTRSDAQIINLNTLLDPSKKLVLVTGHRRENHGQGFIN